MFLVLLTAFTAVCSAEKLDQVFLPPATARTAGGSPGSLQTPFSDYYQGPAGSYDNDAEGVVVDAASPGTKTSPGSEESGLGAPRTTYGSTASKVGDAAFKDSLTGFSRYPTLLKSIPLEDQDPEYQTSIPKEQAIQTKLLQPQDTYDHNSNIVTYENNVDIHKYNYGFESDNGIVVGEKGVADDGVHAQGGYSYKGDDGKVYKVTYTADKAGYQPQGDHLPTPPPIPEEIQKSIDKNTKEEASGIVDDGSYNSQKYNADGDYKESDTNKYQFEKRPEFDTRINGPSIIQNNLPASESTGNSGLPSGSFVNQPANAFTTGLSNDFNGQSNPSTAFDHTLQESSASFGQFLQGFPFNSQAKPTDFGTQFTQQGAKPQFGSPTLSQFNGFLTKQPGQFGSQVNTQTSQKPEPNFASGGISSQPNKDDQIFSNIPINDQYPQGLQDSHLNTHFVANDKPSAVKPNNPAHNTNSKPFGGVFGSTTSSFGQLSQTGAVNNVYLPPSSSNINEKPTQGILPHKTSISSNPITPSNNPFGTPLSTKPQGSQLNSQDSSASLPATTTGPQLTFGFQTPQALNVYQQPSTIQSTAFAQTTNNKYSSSQGQAPLNQGVQKYPQHSGFQNLQQQKPSVGTQFPTSSSLPTQTANNKSPSGVASTIGQGSQFGNTPLTTQTFPLKPTSFTSSNSPSYKPLAGLSNTQTQPSVLRPQQSAEKDKFTQNTVSTAHVGQSQLSQNKPSITQSIFSTRLPLSNQQPQGVDHSYYYNQPAKPFSSPAISPQVSTFPLPTSGQYSQGKQPSNLSHLQGSQKEQSYVHKPVSNTPIQAQSTPTSSVNNNKSPLPSHTSITPVSLPSKTPTLSTLVLQKPAQQSISQSTSIQKPTSSEVSQSGQPSVIKPQVNNKPSGILQNYTPLQTQSQQYTGQLYEYKKPVQELSATANKDSVTSGQKPQLAQIHSGGTSSLESQQSQKETISHLETANPQVGQSPLPLHGNTQSSNTPTSSHEQSKPGSTQFSTQPYKPIGSTSQSGSQPFKPFTTTTQFGTQPLKPFATQPYKPFGSTTLTGTNTYKPFGNIPQSGSHSYKPFGSTTQTNTQTYKPFGNIPQFGSQSYKPFGSTTQFGTQPVKTAGSSFQFGTQPIKPFGTTSQLGTQQSKPSGNTSQFGTQQTKPSGSTFSFGTQSYKPFENTSQFSSQPIKPQISQQPQSSYGQSQTGTVSSTQSGSQSSKPISNVPSTTISQTQTTKPQSSQQGQNVNAGTGNTSQFGTQPQVGQSIFGTAQITNPQLQGSKNQHSVEQSVKPVTTTQTGELQTTQQQLGTQSKPQFGQSHLTTLNNQQQSVPQAQFAGQTYKPFGTVLPSLSGGSLTQTQSEIHTTQTHKTFEKEGNINAGGFNAVPSSQTIQENSQLTNSQGSKPQLGGEFIKPVTTSQTQQQQSTKYEFEPQTKPQVSQNQQTILNHQPQPFINNAFGSQSYNPFENSNTYNFGAHQTKDQFGQNIFPNFGGAHATASASSHSYPGFQFGSQPSGNAYASSFKSQFGQNFLPSQSTAFASATSGPEPYEYNKPNSQAFIPFSGQPYKHFEGAPTPVFPNVQPQFGQHAPPLYTHKQSSFENAQGSSKLDTSSQFNSQTIQSQSPTQGSVVPQPLPSKPESGLAAACCKATQIGQTNQNAASHGSTATPTIQSSFHSQTPQVLPLQGQLKPEEGTIKGEKFDGTKQPPRFDEKTGYHY